MTRHRTNPVLALLLAVACFFVPSLAHADTLAAPTFTPSYSTPLIPDMSLAMRLESTTIMARAVAQANGLTLTPPAAGTNWSVLNYYNLHSGSFAQVVLNKVTTISLIGKYSGLSVDLYAFAGVDDKYKTAVAGLGLVHSWHVANTSAGPIEFTFGVGASGGGQKGMWGAGPIVGLSLRF